MVGAGTLHYTASRHQALVEAVMTQGGRDRRLAPAQRRRLLAAGRALPADCTAALNAWLAALPAEVERRCGAGSLAA